MGYLKTTIKLPMSFDKAWEFFSSPENLQKITPSAMNFRITSELPEEIYPGMFITYKVSPLMGIPINWITEITQIEKHKYFIDEQRSGPYKIWHHEHHFKEIDGGVEMTDIVYYKVPLGFLGHWLEKLFINKKVKSIFDYRTEVLRKIF